MNEQLARHDSILTKLDSFCTTVQQHSTMMSQHTETLDMVQKSLATQQSIMAEMMLKLQHLDKPTPSHTPSSSHQPPLLPLPINTPVTPFHHSSPLVPASLHSTSSTATTRLPKIEVPVFTGEDILRWLFQINHFFAFHQIPDDQRVSIAAFYMAGTALQWFHWLYSTKQLSNWDDFVRKIELRFGPSSFVNHEGALFKLKQTSSLTTYLHEFECLSTRITGLSSQSLLNCFLSGLRDEIQRELYILKPKTLHDAVGMAKLVDDKFQASRSHFHRLLLPRPPPTAPPQPTQRPPPLPIKRLTPTEMAACRAKGLCFNCDSTFTPGHRCLPALFLYLLDEPEDPQYVDDNPPPDPDPSPFETISTYIVVQNTPSISFHALTG